MVNITTRDVLETLGPTAQRVIGGLDKLLQRPSSLGQADQGSITFCRKSGGDLLDALKATSASCVLCLDDPSLSDVDGLATTVICVENPRLAFMRVVESFFARARPQGIAPTAVIAPSAQIDQTAYIGPYTVIDEDCTVGAHTVINSHVHLYPKTKIGSNVTVHSGTVIGSDGFGYERNENGELEKFPHIGGVTIEDDVEIGSNTSVDRGTLSDTIIRQGARIDNQVHVAHNVTIGRNVAVIAQSMLGGSVHLGDGAWIAPSVCIMNQVKIGANATVGLGAVVVRDVPEGVTAMGNPARPSQEFRDLQRIMRTLLTQGS
ncbi:MAG TPA: UDP-3-O-(3-hydroxymyristoyl)glucosamine N-acyltransferase [Kaistia sp.]|jgi:UDP-3-O-[3-hydroxymyristoyl] glucosamine N-acyltransferase|nr:UDP-3-O-(3-hydroxymyristoyl)glucosamine N-acyltransferase [Kaistia sp.]